jgi:cytochrome P450
MVSPILYLSLIPLAVVYWLVCGLLNYLRYERTRKQLGCPPLRKYPARDMILGLDYVYAMLRALKENRFFEFQKETYAGSKAWTANFLGNRMIYSSEPENMKALSTSHVDCFAIEPIRVANGATTPFTGRGVSTSDGAKWQASRDLVKPYFDRAAFANLNRLAGHVDRLMSKIPTDGSTIDMQPLFQRWVSA